jgi:hypothetical protein
LLLLSWKILSIFQPPNPSGNGAKLLFQKLWVGSQNTLIVSSWL